MGWDISADLPASRCLSLPLRSQVHRNQRGMYHFQGLNQGQKNVRIVNESLIDQVRMHQAETANMLVPSQHVTFPLTARLVTLLAERFIGDYLIFCFSGCKFIASDPCRCL